MDDDAALERDLRRARRRPASATLLVLFIVAVAAGGALAWRYVPPSASTMNEVRAALETRRGSLMPTPPEAAIARGGLTAVERATLERQIAAEIAACCTPRFALERIVEGRAPWVAVRASASLLAEGAEWPAPVTRQPLGDPVFVRRAWDGAIVVRLDRSLFDSVGDRADLYVFRRVDGRWLIDGIDYRGG